MARYHRRARVHSTVARRLSCNGTPVPTQSDQRQLLARYGEFQSAAILLGLVSVRHAQRPSSPSRARAPRAYCAIKEHYSAEEQSLCRYRFGAYPAQCSTSLILFLRSDRCPSSIGLRRHWKVVATPQACRFSRPGLLRLVILCARSQFKHDGIDPDQGQDAMQPACASAGQIELSSVNPPRSAALSPLTPQRPAVRSNEQLHPRGVPEDHSDLLGTAPASRSSR